MPTQHKEHPGLRGLPMIDGGKLARSAHTGAQYHLHQIEYLLGRTDSDKFLSQAETNQMHWHLRSFFWELVGTFDLILQWANARFQLGLKESDVKWSKMPNAAQCDQSEWDRVRGALTVTWKSAWYFEVRTFRNFSHRSFLRATAMISDQGQNPPMLFLEPVREGQYYEDIRELLPKYLNEMRQLGEHIFTTSS